MSAREVVFLPIPLNWYNASCGCSYLVHPVLSSLCPYPYNGEQGKAMCFVHTWSGVLFAETSSARSSLPPARILACPTAASFIQVALSLHSPARCKLPLATNPSPWRGADPVLSRDWPGSQRVSAWPCLTNRATTDVSELREETNTQREETGRGWRGAGSPKCQSGRLFVPNQQPRRLLWNRCRRSSSRPSDPR